MPFLQKDYMRRAAAKGGKAEPEDRLVGMMVGSIWVPICTSLPLHTLMYTVNSLLTQRSSSSVGRVPRQSCQEAETGSDP